MAMETMTRVNEQMEVSAKKPMAVQQGVARMRELTRPAPCSDVCAAAGAQAQAARRPRMSVRPH